MAEFLLTLITLLVFVAVIYLIEHRINAKGALFPERPTRLIRVLALAVGILLLGLFVLGGASLESFIDLNRFWFLVLGVALIGYSGGAGQLLGKFRRQADDQDNRAAPAPSYPADGSVTPDGRLTKQLLNRIWRFLLALMITVAILAVAVFGAVLAISNPNEQYTVAYIIGLIVASVIARTFELHRFLRDLFG